MLSGGVQISYRLTEDGSSDRYFIQFHSGGVGGLNKLAGNDFTPMQAEGLITLSSGGRDVFSPMDYTPMAAARRFVRDDAWHTVEIRSLEGHLRVLVDEAIALDVTDETPLLRGTIGFEMQTDSEVFVDDIEVLRVTEPLAILPPSSLLPVSLLKTRRPSVLDYVDRPPPDASLIAIGVPGPDGVTLVTGDPGSVPPSVIVVAATVEYADPVTVRSADDGSFSVSVLSAPGATIQVRYDPYDTIPLDEPLILEQVDSWPGTLMRVADFLEGGDGTPFSGGGDIGFDSGLGSIFGAVTGTVAQPALDAAEDVTLSGTLRVYIPAGVTAPSKLNLRVHLGVDPVFDVDGRQVAAGTNFVSGLLTPTGLPIERTLGPGFTDIHSFLLELQDQSGTLVAPFETTLSLPTSLPRGTHRLYLWVSSRRPLTPWRKETNTRSDNLLSHEGPTVTLFSVGTPGAPRLSPALLLDSPNQGVRGTIAMEERGRYEFANRIASQLEDFIVEPSDRATGELIPYRLEPFLPLVSFADRFMPDAPLVALDLPGGSLTVSVHTPSGEIDELGSHPILQTRTGHAAQRDGRVLTLGGGNPGDVLQLTTLSDDLLYRFAEYGLYTVTVSGTVPDIWGRDYPFAGTFEVWAAETLDVEAASLPATPFQVGDHLPAVVSIYPGVPADVEMSFELHTIDGSTVAADSVSGTANRFGYFDGAGKAFELSEAGEYLVSLRASYTDPEGRLWIGARRWGSGVAAASPTLIAHGRRGIEGSSDPEQRAWFTRLDVNALSGSHINYPYHAGDIIWSTNDDAVVVKSTVQDPDGQIADLLEEREDQSRGTEGVQALRVIGEVPLLLSTSNGLDPTWAPDAIDQWAYSYISAARPGVRVRETVGTEGTSNSYWRFEDHYLAQRGMGAEGDRPNDVKWLFGAAIFKRPDLGIGEVAIYGSLWVEIDDDDPIGSRVFPPFQGAAGGPSGGPIMTLQGQEIDLFLMPTAVRPGTVLEVGDRFVFAGQVGPALASNVTAIVTSPSGMTHDISGQANSIGYFSDPASDFVVDEPGVWTVEVQVLHDGMTSAGPVEAPYPTGGVLGSVDGLFQVYVVPQATSRIDFGLPDLGLYALRRLDRFAEERAALRFFPRIPEGWSNVDGAYTISMPGFILEEGTLEPGGDTLEVVYDPIRLHEEFPNIDLRPRGGTPRIGSPEGLADEVFISVMLSGTDPSGRRVHAAKVITLVGEDVYNLN